MGLALDEFTTIGNPSTYYDAAASVTLVGSEWGR